MPFFLFFLLLSVAGNKLRVHDTHEQSQLFEGDIEVTKHQFRPMQNGFFGIFAKTQGWKNGHVPFTVSDGFSRAERELIEGAMEEISSSTCIRFLLRNKERDFIHFIPGTKCSSKVGLVGGQQNIQMKGSCMRHGTVVHELLHALGLWHEQSRPDRDEYVDIKWGNIRAENKVNFEKYSSEVTKEFQLPYDYSSIMHYSTEAFQKSQGLKTIIPTQQRDAPMGLRDTMSHFDKLKINLMYGCTQYLPKK